MFVSLISMDNDKLLEKYFIRSRTTKATNINIYIKSNLVAIFYSFLDLDKNTIAVMPTIERTTTKK